MKIAIVGSREYSNRTKIKEFVITLKKKFGERLEIVSGGQVNGADGIAKKIALEYEIDYNCLLYTSPSPRDATLSRMPSSA